MTMVEDSPQAAESDWQASQDAETSAAKAREEQIDQLRALGASLRAEFNQRVSDRKGIERRWLEDLRLYNCVYDQKTLDQIKKNGGSEAFLSIGRTKTDAVEAHHSNLLLPTDDRNWEISPTPMPEMKALTGSQKQVHTTDAGHPMTADDMAQGMRDAIEQACNGMRDTIDDQLVECDYSGAVRKIIHQGCVLGTGVARGPIIKNKIGKRWQRVGTGPGAPFQKQTTTDKRPAIEAVDAWDFYPSTGIADISQSDGEFVRHWMSRQQLKDLQFDVDFLKDQLEELLRQNPAAPKVTNEILLELRQMNNDSSIMQSSFEMIEFSGMVSTADLIAIGVNMDDMPLDSYKASIFIVDDIPIKGALELMDGAVEKDFYVWQLSKDDTTLWGRGVPRLMRTSVLLANAAMRMMIDNAGLSVGGQLVIDPTRITPADGNPQMTPRKTWYTDGTAAIENVFRIIPIDPQIQWLRSLFEIAIQLCDEESALPLIAQGDQAQHQTKTKGGMSMLLDQAGVTLRRSIKAFDDGITVKVIDAMYAWNMLYNTDDTIKGDYATKARGASAMLEREAQMEAFTQFTQFLQGNPMFVKVANWPGILEEGAKLLRVNRANLLKSPEEIKAIVAQLASAPPQAPPDPRVQVAQMNNQSAEKREEIRAQATIGAVQMRVGVDSKKIELLMEQLAQESGLSREELTQRMGIEHMKLDSANQRFNAETMFHAQTGEAVT